MFIKIYVTCLFIYGLLTKCEIKMAGYSPSSLFLRAYGLSRSRGPYTRKKERWQRGGGGGGDSHMKQTGMLVVSLRGVNFGFRSRLGFREKNTELCEEKQQSNFLFNLFCLPHCLCDYKLNL